MEINERYDLDYLVLRLITDDGERGVYEQSMRDHHYLGPGKLVGESMRYVAQLQGKWVALLGFCSGTFTGAHRDQWIGWSIPQRLQRLKHVVNNSRFLVMPQVSIPNLASKTLSLALKRLSGDWLKKYGHPVLLAETFVDQGLFRGTCYRAAGFLTLGMTQGYGRSAGKYYHHGQVKTHLARPLSRDALEQLRAPFPSPFMLQGEANPPLLDLNRLDIRGLVGYMGTVEDPRERWGVRYPFSTHLSIITLAALLGIRSFRRFDWFLAPLPQATLEELGCMRRRVYLPPENSAYRRCMMVVDMDSYLQAVARWLESLGHREAIPGALGRIRAFKQRQRAGGAS